MAHAQIPVWESVFSFTLIDIPNEIVNLLSKLEFDGEGDISARKHLKKFLSKCNINIRLLILVLLAGYFLLLSKDESNAGWKHFHLISFLHGFNLHMNF